MQVIIKWKGNKLVKSKIRRLAFNSLFPFHYLTHQQAYTDA